MALQIHYTLVKWHLISLLPKSFDGNVCDDRFLVDMTTVALKVGTINPNFP